jgi:Domain of unknown function (DUF4124)
VFRVLLLALLLLPLSALADGVYRCVGEDGSILYTDNADDCPEAEDTGIESDRTDAAAIATQRQQLVEQRESLSEARQEARSQAAAEASDETQRRENCQTQRDWLQQLQNTPRMYTTDPESGERTMLDTEQRDAKLQDARDRIAAACGG